MKGMLDRQLTKSEGVWALDCLDLLDHRGPDLLEDPVPADALDLRELRKLFLSGPCPTPDALVDRAGKDLGRGRSRLFDWGFH